MVFSAVQSMASRNNSEIVNSRIGPRGPERFNPETGKWEPESSCIVPSVSPFNRWYPSGMYLNRWCSLPPSITKIIFSYIGDLKQASELAKNYPWKYIEKKNPNAQRLALENLERDLLEFWLPKVEFPDLHIFDKKSYESCVSWNIPQIAVLDFTIPTNPHTELPEQERVECIREDRITYNDAKRAAIKNAYAQGKEHILEVIIPRGISYQQILMNGNPWGSAHEVSEYIRQNHFNVNNPTAYRVVLSYGGKLRLYDPKSEFSNFETFGKYDFACFNNWALDDDYVFDDPAEIPWISPREIENQINASNLARAQMCRRAYERGFERNLEVVIPGGISYEKIKESKTFHEEDYQVREYIREHHPEIPNPAPYRDVISYTPRMPERTSQDKMIDIVHKIVTVHGDYFPKMIACDFINQRTGTQALGLMAATVAGMVLPMPMMMIGLSPKQVVVIPVNMLVVGIAFYSMGATLKKTHDLTEKVVSAIASRYENHERAINRIMVGRLRHLDILVYPLVAALIGQKVGEVFLDGNKEGLAAGENMVFATQVFVGIAALALAYVFFTTTNRDFEKQ